MGHLEITTRQRRRMPRMASRAFRLTAHGWMFRVVCFYFIVPVDSAVSRLQVGQSVGSSPIFAPKTLDKSGPCVMMLDGVGA
jgi:hypothetical protein